jgi:hypothetical protein
MCEDMREGIESESAPSADIDKPGANRRADELRAFIAVLIERVFERSGMRVIRQRIADLLETVGVPPISRGELPPGLSP